MMARQSAIRSFRSWKYPSYSLAMSMSRRSSMNRFFPAAMVLSLLRSEMDAHPVWIGVETGEQAEGFHGLEQRHAAAVQRAAAKGPRLAQKRRLQGEINDLRDPQRRAQKARFE